MAFISRTPAYNVKAVLKETGLSADVLRAWERRYALPKPQRTPGGHRLYSEHDIETIKWLQARQSEGMSISRAVQQWNDLLTSGADPLARLAPRGAVYAQGAPAGEARLEDLRRDWLAAGMDFDDFQADEILSLAFALFPVELVCSEILQKGLCEIGRYWYHDRATVQQEHFVTAMAERRVDTLISSAPTPRRGLTVAAGCPHGERHAFPVMLLNLLLRRKGIHVVYLGADIPLNRLEQTVDAIRPDLIVLAAQQITAAAALLSTAQALQARGTAIAYGGLIFNRSPKLRERIPAAFLGETLNEAVERIDRLPAYPLNVPIPPPLDANNHRRLAQLFREKRGRIEAQLPAEISGQAGLQDEHLREANYYFGNSLAAALELGDPAFLETDLEWAHPWLAGRKVSAESLYVYLEAYSRSIRGAIGDDAAALNGWLDNYLSQANLLS